MSDGLSNSFIQSIGQDKYGFMWIGTGNGLNIYDGIEFTHHFNAPNIETTLPGNSISTMAFENDSVWVGTRTGLCLMDVISKKCKRIDLGMNTDVRTLYLEENSKTLWIGTNTGLLKYDTKNDLFQEFNTSNSNISHNVVRAIHKDNDGNLWIGTFDKLNKLSPNSRVFKVFDLKTEYSPSIKNNLILSILSGSENSDSLLWIGTGTGLVLFNRHTNSTRFFREENSGLTNSVIKALSSSKSGKVWAGTDFGLAEIDNDFKMTTHLHDPFKNNSIANSIVWTIFEDNSGTTWFGTNNGLSMLSKSSDRFRFFPMTFTRRNNIAGYEIRDIIEDSKGDYWLATQFGVVNYNPTKNLFETFNSEQPTERKLAINGTSSVWEDKQGRIWIASNGGVIVWNRSTGKLDRYTADFNSNSGLRTNYIQNFHELEDGTILVSTYKGLHKVIENKDGLKFEFIGKVNAVMQGSTNLWSHNKTNLLTINPQTFEQKSVLDFEKENISNQIYYMIQNGKNIWLGMQNGLLQYDIINETFKIYEIKSNTSYPIINLLADNDGNIWASSYTAILKFTTETKEFEIYPNSDEIRISSFASECCAKCINGDLVFGGQDGFIRFSPEIIAKSEFKPPVRLTKLVIANQEVLPTAQGDQKAILNSPISFTEKLILNYSERSFSLEFSSLQYGNRNGIRYAYMLEGADLDWNYINETNGSANFSNLSPGKYVFRLKGSNNDGVWNENETTLTIKIKPPLWASPFVIALYAVLLVLITITLIYYYASRAKMKNELKIARLEKIHTEDIAKTRQQFITNISHELRTPLSLILGPVEKLAHNSGLNNAGKNLVQLIENNARRLLWLNNQLLDFRKLENKALDLRISNFGIIEFTQKVYSLFTDKAERNEIKYTFNTDIEQLEVKMDLRKIETILFNLLSNAFKFTPKGGEISVTINSCVFNSENALCISVKDTGIGILEEDQKKIFDRFYQAKEAIKMERGSGIGLTLVNEYVLMHQGKIELVSQAGKGSEFKVILPSNINYESKNLVIYEPETPEPSLKTNHRESFEKEIVSSISGNTFVLLVEDDHEIAEFIRVSLSNKYNVQHALNGKEALQIISKQLPDLIISDVVMPEMNGIEFTRKIKSNSKTAHIPIILLTGQTETEKQLEGLKSGADAYITKPFEINLLEVRVQNLLKHRNVFTEFLKRDNISKPKNIQIASQDEKMLKKIVACIEQHISDPDLDINKVCKETGFSYSILLKKVKNLTGQNVNEFIRTIRVRRAEQLLRTKKYSVAEVMYETGFSNHSYFSKCFRKYYKMSPKEYINQV
jgi:signal transduction histidine kinase/ligand-binding sensor domain-containing protein/AraC-like DNA-binding protein